jgi:hypothetical protein
METKVVHPLLPSRSSSSSSPLGGQAAETQSTGEYILTGYALRHLEAICEAETTLDLPVDLIAHPSPPIPRQLPLIS